LQQGRFAMLARSNPEESQRLLALAQQDITARWQFYEHLAAMGRSAADAQGDGSGNGNGDVKAEAAKEASA